MTHRPWPIVVIALFHILAPLINFIMSAQLLDMSYGEYWKNQLHYGHSTLLLWAVPFLAGLSLLTFRMWSYYAFLLFMTIASVFTLTQRLLYPHRIDIFLFLLLELINFLVILYFLSPAVKRIYLNKRIRWWQHSARYLVSLEARARIVFENTQLPSLTIPAKLENISEGGAYIQTKEPLNSKDIVFLQFKMFNKDYDIRAQVIHAQANGYGLLFNDSLAIRLEMRTLTRKLKKSKAPIRGKEMSSLESFKFWFADLLKTGHGIFPK
jgi:hypothetical protein